MAVFWRMEVEVVEEVWKAWNDGMRSERDWSGGKRKL